MTTPNDPAWLSGQQSQHSSYQTHDAGLKAGLITTIGTSTVPVTSAATARPSTTGVVYWLCAKGVTPTNAAAGDIVWNSAT